MSFKDVRDLSEHLKLIGYPKKFQLSIFCTNYGGPTAFQVVADILKWLINRLEPSTPESIHSSTGITDFVTDENNDHKLITENDRVQFIRSVTEFLITRCGIKINPRKLYSSSFSSAKEILKITTLLLNTSQNVEHINDSIDNNDIEIGTSIENMIDFSDPTRVNQLRRARELSSELTNHGAVLYELLNKEASNKEIRNFNAGRSIELSQIERTLKQSISHLENELKSSKEQLEQIKIDKANIDSKIERKMNEMERSKHRLEALKKVRPAYLDEFNKCEEELKEIFSQYILRVRVIDSLKAQLSTSNQRTPTPPNIPIVRPSETSMTNVFPEDLMDNSDDSDGDDDTNDNHDEKIVNFGDKNEGKLGGFGRTRRATAGRVDTRTRHSYQIKDSLLRDDNIEKDDGSDVDLDSSINSDESDSVLAELARDNLLDHEVEDIDSFSNTNTKEIPIPAQSDDDF